MKYRLAMLLPLLLFAEAEANSTNVSISGNNRISTQTIVSYSGLQTQSAQEYSSAQVDRALKNLYATSFFSDVKISQPTKDSLIITVVENPTIRNIAFEGNKAISDKNLNKLIRLQSRDVYTLAKIHSDLGSIKNAYQKKGFHSVVIEPKIITLPQNKVDLVYEITEQSQTKIKKINFVGNHQAPTAELKASLLSKEQAFYRFFSSHDIYEAERLNLDQELLKQYYLRNGYFDFRVISVLSELTPTKSGCVITFLLEEGSQYKLSDVTIATDLPALSQEKLLHTFSIRKNAVLNIDDVEEAQEKISLYLKKTGYAFAEVSYEFIKNRESKTIFLKFIIKEGSRIYINKINVNNNTRTMDKVIRRTLKIKEGEQYNLNNIEKSQYNLSSLGYFQDVQFTNKRTEYNDRVDINVDVKETSTGSMNFTAGYNTQTGIMGGVSLLENNFLGKGQSVELLLQKTQRSSTASFGFTESYFMNQPINAGFDIFASNALDKYSAYQSEAVGFDLRMGYEPIDRVYHGLRYHFNKLKIMQPEDKQNSRSLVVRDWNGTAYTSSIGHTISWSALDSIIQPTRGIKLELLQDLAGIGGDIQYLKHQIVAEFHTPLYGKKVVLHISGRAGKITGLNNHKVHLVNNYSLEQNYLRGFEPNGISPRVVDEQGNSGHSIGGSDYCAGTAEVSFPIGLPEELGVNGVAFIDTATLFGYSLSDKLLRDSEKIPQIAESAALRTAVGLGVVWRSPFGKIKINYGIPIKKEKFDLTQKISFSMGGMF